MSEENGVYDFCVEVKVAGSDAEAFTNDGGWHKCKAHPWCEVGARLKTSGVGPEDVTRMSRESLEQELLTAKLHEARRNSTSQGIAKSDV